MVLQGTIVNSLLILLGGIIGLLFRNKIKDSFKDIIMKSIGLGVIVIGLKEALNTDNSMILMISLIFGSIIGQLINIEKKLESLGDILESKFKKGGGSFTKGFVMSSLVYCVGAMAILGSLNSGLLGDHTILYTKGLIDGVSSIIFTSLFGVGVIFSSISVLIYQGSITIMAGWIEPLLTEEVIVNISAVGGILIVGIGINVLEIKKIPVGNMLPAVIIPLFISFF